MSEEIRLVSSILHFGYTVSRWIEIITMQEQPAIDDSFVDSHRALLAAIPNGSPLNILDIARRLAVSESQARKSVARGLDAGCIIVAVPRHGRRAATYMAARK